MGSWHKKSMCKAEKKEFGVGGCTSMHNQELHFAGNACEYPEVQHDQLDLERADTSNCGELLEGSLRGAT